MQKQREVPGLPGASKSGADDKLDGLLLKEMAERAGKAQDAVNKAIQAAAPKLRRVDACCTTYYVDDDTGKTYRDKAGKRPF